MGYFLIGRPLYWILSSRLQSTREWFIDYPRPWDVQRGRRRTTYLNTVNRMFNRDPEQIWIHLLFHMNGRWRGAAKKWRTFKTIESSICSVSCFAYFSYFFAVFCYRPQWRWLFCHITVCFWYLGTRISRLLLLQLVVAVVVLKAYSRLRTGEH